MGTIEDRLSGALREIAAFAPTFTDQSQLTRVPTRAGRSRGPLVALGAGAAVLVVVGASVATAALLDSDGSHEGVPSDASTVVAPSVTNSSATRDAVDTLAAQLVVFEGTPGYGRTDVDYQQSSVVLWWKGDVPAAVTRVIEDAPRSVRVTQQTARFDQIELNAAASKIMSASQTGKVRGTVVGVSPNQDLTGLVVDVFQPGAATQEQIQVLVDIPVSVNESPAITQLSN